MVTNILVDLDASAAAQPALEGAADFARQCGARLRIVDVTTAPALHPLLPLRVPDEAMMRRREQLARLAARYSDVVSQADVLRGPPVPVLIEEIERLDHDLLVRAHTRDIAAPRSSGFSVVDRELFHRCPCTVWTLGAGATVRHPTVAAAVEPGAEDDVKRDLNRDIVEAALLFSRLQSGTLSLVNAWQPVARGRVASYLPEHLAGHINRSRQLATTDLEHFAQSFGDDLRDCRLALRQGEVEDVLPEFVVTEGIDLLVIGSMARTGVAGWLRGNTAERLLERLPCSVVVVKARRRQQIRAPITRGVRPHWNRQRHSA